MVANSTNKSSEQAFYNVNNGFHQQERKILIKFDLNSFGLKNAFPLIGMKDALKNI